MCQRLILFSIFFWIKTKRKQTADLNEWTMSPLKQENKPPHRRLTKHIKTTKLGHTLIIQVVLKREREVNYAMTWWEKKKPNPIQKLNIKILHGNKKTRFAEITDWLGFVTKSVRLYHLYCEWRVLMWLHDDLKYSQWWLIVIRWVSEPRLFPESDC